MQRKQRQQNEKTLPKRTINMLTEVDYKIQKRFLKLKKNSRNEKLNRRVKDHIEKISLKDKQNDGDGKLEDCVQIRGFIQ